MRRRALAALLVALGSASPAVADQDGSVEGELDAAPVDRSFWEWLMAPHAREVEAVLLQVRTHRGNLHQNNLYPVFDPSTGLWSPTSAELRARLHADLAAMLRYALRLDPHDLELRRELALVLADAEDPGAERALLAYLADEQPDRPTGEARLRLAALQARRGDLASAAAQLRVALGGGFVEPRGRQGALLLLAQVYMADGRMAEAIDLLETATAHAPAGYAFYGGDLQLQFALAVAYDRDEQLSRAHAILERVAQVGVEQLTLALGDPYGNRVPFVAPSERLYWSALQLEALGHLVDARAEWITYAAVDGARFAGRARAHVRAIDGLLDERAAARPARRRATPATPTTVPILVPPTP